MLSVIGVGLGRTGTVSLKAALEQLGFGPCFHDPLGRAAKRLWSCARRKQTLDWDEIFLGYSSAADFPICLFYRELAAKYPMAKFVLTLREPLAWFESTQATILSPRQLEGRPRLSPSTLAYWADLFLTVFGDDLHDQDAVIAAYKRHNGDVCNAIPPDRLLAYEVEQGWPPLCDFLSVEHPDTPFPTLNSRQEFSSSIHHILS